jgi:hypothetical protein
MIAYKKKLDQTFAVSGVPFEMKENFKKVFPSAKWNPDGKVWIVGSRSEKRLQQWIQEMTALASSIEDDEAAELTSRKIQEIRDEAETWRERIHAARSEAGNIKNLAELLKAEKAKLAEVKKEFEIAELEKQEEYKKVATLLSGIIDPKKILLLAQELSKNQNFSGRQYFDEAKKELKEMREKLAAAGLKSEGLNELISININRPDRDKPSNVKMVDVLKISKIE